MTLLTRLQRWTSHLPGGRALKRRLHNDPTACGLTYRLTTRGAQRFTILTYHLVVDQPDPYYPWAVSTAALEAQLRMFRRHCAVLSLDEIIARLERGDRLPERCVALTFDDGYRSVFTRAWPLLRRFRLPATLYVAVQAVERGALWPDVLRHAIRTATRPRLVLDDFGGRVRAWSLTSESDRLRAVHEIDAQLKRLPAHESRRALDALARDLVGCPADAIRIPEIMLSWEELQAMARDGLTIGAHTVSHPILTRLSESEAAEEITTSRRRLETRLGVPVMHFAYPNGQPEDFSPAIVRLVQQAGFRSAVTTIAGFNPPAQDRFALKRVDGGYQDSLRALVRAMTREA